jgi:hypothetical protein
MGLVLMFQCIFSPDSCVTPGVMNAGTDSTDLSGLAGYDSPLSGVSSVGDFSRMDSHGSVTSVATLVTGDLTGGNRIGWRGEVTEIASNFGFSFCLIRRLPDNLTSPYSHSPT